MPSSRVHPSPGRLRSESAESPIPPWVGWAAYLLIALVGFCFGVWVGNLRPEPSTEVAKATPKEETPPDKSQNTPIAGEPKKTQKIEPMQTPTLPPKKDTKTTTPIEPPKKNDTRTPEPKKTDPVPMVTPVSFATQVQPIFKSKCMLCHGDTKSLKGDLDLRTLASIAKGGETGKALVPGNLKDSNIWTWIDDGQMPPPDRPQLSDAEKKLIKDWILSGGK